MPVVENGSRPMRTECRRVAAIVNDLLRRNHNDLRSNDADMFAVRIVVNVIGIEILNRS